MTEISRAYGVLRATARIEVGRECFSLTSANVVEPIMLFDELIRLEQCDPCVLTYRFLEGRLACC